jgi:hypothetical protein
LQEEVRQLSDDRVAASKFAVALLFWDEIVSGLLLNPGVFKAHYPQIQLASSDLIDKERLIAALELGYYGADLWESIKLMYGEFGSLAQVDPDEFIATLRILERRVQQLLPPEDATPILDSLREVRAGCLRRKRAESGWHSVEIHAKRVSSRVQGALSLISFAESKVLDLGLQLGRVYHHGGDPPDVTIRRQVAAKMRVVLPGPSDSGIRKVCSLAKKSEYAFQWAQRIYSFLDRSLRFSN